jgi:arginine decarboxylase
MKKRRSKPRPNLKTAWKLGRDEFNTGCFDVARSGELIVQEGNYQYNVHELAKKFGSPMEIVFPFLIESRARDLIDCMNAFIKLHDYKGKFFYHYPMKVNQNREYVLALISEGAHLETSSANELWIVKRLWEQEKFSQKIRVLCNGPKTPQYLKLIDELKRKGLTIIPLIEEKSELEHFENHHGPVGIRLDLNVKVQSHWDKRYNRFGLQEDQLLALGKVKNLSVISYHISSQIESIKGLVAPIERAVMMYAKLREKNPQLDTINIGGGAGVPYEKKPFYNAKKAANAVVKAFKSACAKYQVKEPNIICEWGRYAVAPAQITLFRVLSEKAIKEGSRKKWYTIDGSFINDLTDTWAIHQRWHIVPVNGIGKRRLQPAWLCGASCDSDDKYTSGGEEIMLPKLDEAEDLYIAVFDTGAYQDSLASHHCLLSSPVKLIAQNGEVKVARRRESPEEVGKMFGW